MKILLIAFSIKPNEGSEYGVGWNWVANISSFANDVHVLVRDAEGQKEAIDAYILNNPMPNTTFHYYEVPKFLNVVRGEIHTGQKYMRLYYMIWQIMSFIHIRNKIDCTQFNILQHITFVSDWIPSIFIFLKVPKVIFGPMGSQDMMPLKLKYPLKIRIKDIIFNSVKYLSRRFNPIFKYNLYKSDLLVGISESSLPKIGLKYANKFTSFIPLCFDKPTLTCKIQSPKSLYPNDEFVIFSACPLLYFKNFDLAIEGFYKYSQLDIRTKLYIAGDGPMMEKLVSLVTALNLHDRVIFMGWIPAADVYSFMESSAHAFLFPTSESGGTVSLEAASYGLPIVCLSGYGYDYFVKDSKGAIAVDASSREKAITEIAEALHNIRLNYFSYSSAVKRDSELFSSSRLKENIKYLYKKLCAD